jgi:hypothetical protein
MGANSKAKQLHKFVLHKLVLLQSNMEQWARVDGWLGEEMVYRLGQFVALKDGDETTVIELHNKRISCLEKALEILRTCPACGPEEHDG